MMADARHAARARTAAAQSALEDAQQQLAETQHIAAAPAAQQSNPISQGIATEMHNHAANMVAAAEAMPPEDFRELLAGFGILEEMGGAEAVFTDPEASRLAHDLLGQVADATRGKV